MAVIGASEKPGGVGRALLENLGTFSGTLYPVNAQRDVVLGKKAYRDIGSVPTKVDLAVIATPAVTVPGIIAECAAAGVQAAIVISAGFKERRRRAAPSLSNGSSRPARGTPLRVIGPNCLGVMAPHINLNATFSKDMARTGNVDIPDPERSPRHRDHRLEPEGEGGVQRVRLDRLDAGYRMGRPDPLPRQ